MLLALSWTVSYSQGIPTPPRWRIEAIVKDLIRLDKCDSLSKVYLDEIAQLKASVTEHQGKEVTLQNKIDEYVTVVVPTLKGETKNVADQKKIVEDKLKARNFWSIVKDVIIVALVVWAGALALR